MSTSIRVLLADDHPLLDESIENSLAKTPDIFLLGTAVTLQGALRLYYIYQPDIVLLGGQFLHELTVFLDEFPQINLIALVTNNDEKIIRATLVKGVVSCIQKSEALTRMPQVIRHVAQGETRFSPSCIEKILASDAKNDLKLTEQEQQILQMVVNQKTDREIAQLLHLSERTVRRKLQHIYEKLEVRGRVAAAYEAGRRDLFNQSSPTTFS